MLPSKSICMRTPYEVLSGGESGIRTHGRSHVTGFQELKRCSALFRKLNIFCNFTCIFADISPTAVSRNYYSKWENYCQKLKKFHLESNIHLHMDNYHPFRNYADSQNWHKMSYSSDCQHRHCLIRELSFPETHFCPNFE